MSDDANITGKGADILLPPQGNPFKAEATSETTAEVAGKAAPVEDGQGGPEEPTDLSPEDIAAMFPASQDERNKVPPAAEVPPPVLSPDEAAPAALTPEQVSAMLADTALNAHEGARPEMAIHNGGSGRPSKPGENQINLNEFNPDAPVGGTSPARRTKAAITGPVDLAAFDPDAPVMDAPADATAFNTDAPPAGSAPNLVPDPDLSAPAAPTTSVVLSASSAPNASAPAATISISTPAAPAPDPFASLPPTLPESQALPVVDSAPLLVDTSAGAIPAVPTSPTNNQAAVTVSAGGSTVTAAVSAPPSIDDGSPGDDSGDTLPSVPPISLPVQEDPGVLDQLVTDKSMADLWSRIDRIEALAVQDENSLPVQRTKNFENLKAARNLLLGGRKNYEDALRYIDEVESNLGYIKRVRQWSYSWGTTLFLYNVIWVGVLALGYLWAPRIGDQFAASGLDKQFGIALWVTIVSGGLGGISKSLFALGSHVVKQDFDVQHRLWYYQSPVIGCIMGIFVFIISQIGIIAVSAGSSNSASTGYAVYILAWMVGFQQNLALQLFEKVKDAILPDEKDK